MAKTTIQQVIENKAKYRVDVAGKSMHTVTINGNVFTDYSAFSFLWEKTYVKSPVRSGTGAIGNLNSYATFLTPHLKIDFSLMSIESYRTLMNLIYSANEFVVTCYDVVNDKQTTNKMYFTTEEMPKLWTIVDALNGNENAIMLLGVQDYTVEMVGTNADMGEVDVLYYDNEGKLIEEATKQVIIGAEFVVGYDFIAPNGYRFDGEWKDERGTIRRNGDVIKVNQYDADTMSFKLYAQVVPTTQYTLSFNYGIGKELITQSAGVVSNVTITKGETVKTATEKANLTLSDGSVFTFPENGTGAKEVVYTTQGGGNRTYNPYIFGGWFWTPEGAIGTRVYGTTVYDYDLNRTIYQIYIPLKYTITYETNTGGAITLQPQQVAYGSAISLPILNINGKVFKGWYFSDGTSDKEQQAPTKMLPFDITVYAKWE